MSTKGIHIGTSGWHYDHWLGPFYPERFPKPRFLEFYAGHFKAVEVNNSFYRLPEKETFLQWQRTVPEDFVFAVKASRYITHMKKLKDPEEPVFNFLERASGLGSRLGPVLFQLPPRWRVNPERLDSFLNALPPGHSYVVEFRDSSWFDERVYDILRQHDTAFCIHDMEGRPTPRMVTASLAYVRFHGPGRRYAGKYTMDELRGWAEAFAGWVAESRTVHCYFNNDERGYAIENARELTAILEENRA